MTAMSSQPDTAERVAFDPAAPQAERSEALGQLQKAHAPSSLRDLILPQPEMREVVDYLADQWREADLNKAMRGNIVPFPSKFARERQRGMQSVTLDNLQITARGDYWEKPTAFGFDAMRQMVAQTPVLNAVILTRVRQVQRFCRVNESGEGPGFTVAHIDRGHELDRGEQESIRLLNRFIMNCGWENNPRARRRLRRDSFGQFTAKLVRDSLALDSAPIETEMARDKTLGIDGLYAVDGATIRLCTEDGYRGDDEIFALQVVQGRISTAYTHDDLIYEPRNPQSDVLVAGYGCAETEMMIRVVTGFLNAMSLNIKGFDSNAIPMGVMHLTGNYSEQDVAAFKRYWNSMVRGVQNRWVLPVMVSKDQESRASFERFGVEFNEMYFSKWMTFLTSIICAIYGMSPAEINFDSFTAGNTSNLSGSDTDEKLAASKDSGLWPLLSYFEGLFTDYVISDFSEKYVFRWTGIDQDDAAKREERARLVMNVNEMRAQERLPPLEGDFGDAPLNPSLTGIWMQLKQQQQPQDFGKPPGQGGGGQEQGQAEGGDEDQGDGDDQAQADPSGAPPARRPPARQEAGEAGDEGDEGEGGFSKAHISGYTKRSGAFVAPHEDKRPAARQDPALDPQSLARMAAGANRLQAHEAKIRAEEAPRRDANYQRIIAAQPEWETLEGVEILRSPGSAYAAIPASGKRNARQFQVFNVKTREPVCQLKKDEVTGWLVNRAMEEQQGAAGHTTITSVLGAGGGGSLPPTNNPDAHPEDAKTPAGLVAAIKRLVGFAFKHVHDRRGRKTPEREVVGRVSPEQADAIAAKAAEVAETARDSKIKEAASLLAKLNVSGFRRLMDEDAVRHAYEEHGVGHEKQEGQIPITQEDFERVPEILATGTVQDVVHILSGGIPGVVTRARIGADFFYVEEVRTGRQALAFKTMWKRPVKEVPPERGAPDAFASVSRQSSETLSGRRANSTPTAAGQQPLAKAIGLPPVLRIELPEVE